MIALILIFSFILGAMIGSFINVVIYRLPRDISVVTPRSACPHCKTVIPLYHNIPLVSFLLLRGRCFSCKGRISFRYPLIELILGIAALGIVAQSLSSGDYPFWGFSAFYFTIFAALLAHFLIDLEHQILPDEINIYLGALFLLYAIIHYDYLYWLIGFTIGLLFPLTIAWGFYKLRGVHGLGGGDIKLYAALGLFLGPLGILQNIFLSSMVGSLFAGGLILLGKMDKTVPIPFGPFIILIATLQIFLPFFGITFPSIF